MRILVTILKTNLPLMFKFHGRGIAFDSLLFLFAALERSTPSSKFSSFKMLDCFLLNLPLKYFVYKLLLPLFTLQCSS